MTWLLLILVIIAVAFFGRQAWQTFVEGGADRVIDRRIKQAKEKGIVGKAIFVAHRLGDYLNGFHFYEDAEMVITVNTSVVLIKQSSDGVCVFQAKYSDTPIRTNHAGTSLVPRDGGGYDVVHEAETTGGFWSEIEGYVPGAWESHLMILVQGIEQRQETSRRMYKKLDKERRRRDFRV